MCDVVALRSRRLEALFGGRLGDITYQQILGLVVDHITEAYDLDFKSELYGGNDEAKRALAGDVAALANTAGGVVVVGVQEDEHARAVDVPDVDLGDAQETRMRQIVASLVAPMPVLDILPIRNPSDTSRGVWVIAVPRSTRAPHAVLVNDGLRYPRRNGSTTRYLSEPEVAAAYRDRYASQAEQADRAEVVERELTVSLDTTNGTIWSVVSLVPDVRGDFDLNGGTLHNFRQELLGTAPLIVNTGRSWQIVGVGLRRLRMASRRLPSGQLQSLAAELHTDGSGAFAAVVPGLTDNPGMSGDEDFRVISDEHVADVALSGLRFLARHATERAAAGGSALARLRLYPWQSPTRLGAVRGGWGIEQLGDVTVNMIPPAELVLSLDDLVVDGPHLVEGAHFLASELFQAFGWPEAAQLSRDGKVRRRYWHRGDSQARIEAWAQTAGVEVTDDTL